MLEVKANAGHVSSIYRLSTLHMLSVAIAWRIPRAIKVNKAQVEILSLVDEHPERVPLGSGDLV